MSVNGTVRLIVKMNELLDSAENNTGARVPHELADAFSKYEFTDGTTSLKADIVWSDRRTVAASATDTIDLGTGGGLTDSFGASIVPFAEVVLIVIANRSSVAGDELHIGPATSNGLVSPFSGTNPLIRVPPRAWAVIGPNDAGWAVTDGTGDLLRVVEAGTANSVTYDIFIVGRSA